MDDRIITLKQLATALEKPKSLIGELAQATVEAMEELTERIDDLKPGDMEYDAETETLILDFGGEDNEDKEDKEEVT